MVKYQFGKNWSWCTDLPVDSYPVVSSAQFDLVYKLDSPVCHFGSCKTNCAQNPFCLNGLGEKKLIGLLQKEPAPPLDRSQYFRSSSDEYVGLVNLGATCYINAYLQVWFNNLFFREKILQMPFEKAKMIKMNGDESSMPELVIEPLECLGSSFQLIFTLMKETIRKSIDTSFFIQSIGLDQHIQQDAQEFSQLFLTTLQSIFKSKFDPKQSKKQSNLIEDLFQGEISYITECSSCQLRSIRNSNFVELTLNIQNSSTITDCIEELLKDESMDGDNQYFCDQCQSKRDARRITQLDTLPPVLNLQLLRFIYDRNTGSKKKLSSRIKFYEQLDLNKYVKKRNNEAAEPNYVYQLGSILMHVGKSAYSGHYTAQIRNFQSQEWFNFNDESINKIKKKQQLGCTDEETDAAASKKSDEKENAEKSTGGGAKTTPAFSTANAYLLVYYRTDWVNKFIGKPDDLNGSHIDVNNPSNQSDCVLEDNKNLESWFDAAKNSRMDQSESKMTERTFIKDVYDKLWVGKPGALDVKKLTNSASKRSARAQKQIIQQIDRIEIKEETSTVATTTPPSSPLSESIAQTSREDMFFMPIETIKQIMSGDWLASLSNTKKNGSSALASLTPMTKYLCSHKRLNPLAINRVKVVNRSGLDLIKSIYSIDLIGSNAALAAYDDQTTRCMACVNNCITYLKCKEKLKLDSKLIKQILDKDADDENESLVDAKEESTPSKRGRPANNGSAVSPFRSRNGKGSVESGQNGSGSVVKKPIQYWIGKETLRQWPQLILRKHESVLPSTKFVDNSEGLGHIEELPMDSDACEIVEIKSSTDQQTASDVKSSLEFFNQDILCPHNQLSPTSNKRLIKSSVWQKIYNSYFEDTPDPDCKIFTSQAAECGYCLRINEEQEYKKSQVKGQKDLLADLYSNKQRPTLSDCLIDTPYYIIPAEFIKEWRSIIKSSKYRDLSINNALLLCPHFRLPFSEHSFDPSKVALLRAEEWFHLKENYENDGQDINVIKRAIPNELETANEGSEPTFTYVFDFSPEVCQICLEQNELDKFFFENKKVIIRLIEDDQPASNGSNGDNQANEDDVIYESTCKKPRIEGQSETSGRKTETKSKSSSSSTMASSSAATSDSALPSRRSKRTRRNKGDIEVCVSSNNTIKQVKSQVTIKLSRLISEQHLFFRGEELENEKSVAYYKISPGDIIQLVLEKPDGAPEEPECQSYEAMMPEVGFKGTNLMR